MSDSYAPVVKLVNTGVSKTPVARLIGSSPIGGT
jgi:hypothetical protein